MTARWKPFRRLRRLLVSYRLRPSTCTATSKWCYLLSLTHYRVKQSQCDGFSDDVMGVIKIKALQVCSNFKVITAFFDSPQGQTILQGCPPSPMWCYAAQGTRVVVNGQLASPLQQCSSMFLALDSDFFWWKIRLLWFARLLILLIWLPAASSCSSNSRGHWKESSFRQERTLWQHPS